MQMSLLRTLQRFVGGGSLVGSAVILAGGLTLYQSIYNVEGGHAAVVFNRFVGIKVRRDFFTNLRCEKL
jgi:hypothetical protein